MVDTSGSMYGFPMKLARIVAEKIIQTFSEHDRVNIILYNSTHVTGKIYVTHIMSHMSHMSHMSLVRYYRFSEIYSNLFIIQDHQVVLTV